MGSVSFILLDSDATYDASLEIICTSVNSFSLTIRGKLVPNCKLSIQLQNLFRATF